VKKYRTEIVAENVIMLDRKPGTASGPAAPDVTPEAPAAPAEPEVNVDDIPF
jgi:hypothetical protein